MEHVGFIIETNGNKAVVEIKRPTLCGDNCANCSVTCQQKGHFVTLKNDIGAKVGDKVVIEGDSGKMLKYTFIVYMIPLAFLLFGVIVAYNNIFTSENANREIYSLLIGFGLLLVALLIVRLIDNSYKNRQVENLKIVKIIQP